MQLYFEREELTLIAQAEDISGDIRRLISAREARSLLKSLKDWKIEAKKQWKARADTHQSALDSGDPEACARVCKNLSGLQSEGKLRQIDRDHLKHALEMLTDELSRVLGKRRSQTRRQILEATAA